MVDDDCVEEGSVGHVDDACRNCYADNVSVVYGWSAKGNSGPPLWGPGAARRFFGDKHWREPLLWARAAHKARERHKVFCGSMFDVFEGKHPVAEIDEQMQAARARLWPLMEATGDDLDWLLLSKRPENAPAMLPPLWRDSPPPFVWQGTSAAGPQALAKRWPLLAAIPAQIRFLSWEPSIAPISLAAHLRRGAGQDIHWLIAGCESNGNGLGRPAELQWFRDVRDQCRAARIAFFMKQMGIGGRLVKSVDQFPCELQAQEFPPSPLDKAMAVKA